MNSITREMLKDIFKHVKHFRIPDNLEDTSFKDLIYYSWLDQTDFVFYTVYDFKGEIKGIRWRAFRFPSKPLGLGFCDVCRNHRKRDEMISISSHTQILPTGVSYRTRGFQICIDFLLCNEDLTRTEGLDLLYSAILN